MKRILAILILLCCIVCTATAESASYFEEKGYTVHEVSDEYIPVERAIVMYLAEQTLDCGMKCSVVSDTVEEGERLLHVRLTLLSDEFDPGVISTDMYVYPTIYDYYTGTRCTLRDSVPASARMKFTLNGEEISVRGKVIDRTFVYYDNYVVYTVDYTFEMPSGYDGIVIACFPAFEFEDYNDFRARKDTQNYLLPEDGTDGVYIRVR